MTGATTTGSIDAKLTLDASEFNRGMDEAKAKAREVGALAPDVKVNADVGPALAKLEAVARAERDLDFAYQRSAISQEKLSKVTEKYGEDSVQAASARLTNSKALAAESDAESKLTRLKQDSTVAEDKNTEATKRGTQANNQHVSGLQILIGLAPAVLAAAAPVAAGAVALGTSFGVMGVAGVLAIKGIKDEMQSGTAAGNQYSVGIGVLKGDLDKLSATSANAMLGAFNGAVGDINARMPFLNQMIQEGSGLLGQMGGTAIRGVLNGLQQMNPLIEQGGVELGHFVTWLFSFAGSNGFQQFIDYASNNLPGVMHLIESLVTLAGNVLAAFAPLGPGVIAVLTGISDGLSSLPLPILAGLVTTATTIAPAFTIARTAVTLFGTASEVAGGAVTFLGISANLAIPVIGILVAAVAGLGIAAATSAMGTNQGTAALTTYTQALKDDNEALGEHVRATAAKALSDAGAFDAARTLGVSQKTLTDALMGVGDAQKIVNDALNRGKDFQNDYTKNVISSTSHTMVQSEAQRKMGSAIDVVTKQLAGQSGAIEAAKQQNLDEAAAMGTATTATTVHSEAVQRQAAAYGTTVQAYQDAVTAQQATAAQLAQTTLQLQLQGNAAGLLKQAFDELNGKSLSLAQAQTAAASATNSVTTSFHQNGLAIEGGTAAAVANQQAIQSKVAADQASAEATAKATGSTEAGTKAYGDSKTALENSMRSQGLLTDKVQAYIDKLYDVNNFKPAPVILNVNTSAADLALAGFQTAINRINGQRVVIYAQANIDAAMAALDTLHANSMVTANSYATGGAYRSGGGTVDYKASGGPVSYLDSGGFPGGPRGTDTVPTWLTPDEFVMRRASAQSIGLPALTYMNQTGQLPPQAGNNAGTQHNITVYIGGEAIDPRMVQIVDERINDLSRDLSSQRRS